MRILMTGATGLVGTRLRPFLVERGHEIVAHSRTPRQDGHGVRWFTGPSDLTQTYIDPLGACDAIVNLAGAPIARVWTQKTRQAIVDSRIKTTEALVGALAHATRRSRVLVSASACGYYGPCPREQCDENSPLGTGFLASVCADWETRAKAAQALQTRVVPLRFGVILAAEGGILPVFVRLARAYLGGPVAANDAWMSWIHVDDAVRLTLWALEQDDVSGAINAVAPNPTRHADFIQAVGRILTRPMWLKPPTWALRLMLGAMARELMLTSQQVVPKRAMQIGFGHDHPHLESALRDLLARP